MNNPAEHDPMNDIARLHALRENLVFLKYTKAASYADWLDNNAGLINVIAHRTNEINDLEAQVKAHALNVYLLTGDKRPYPGVEVKLFATLDYKLEDALPWAQTHQMALELNKRVFEAIASGPAGQSMAFVTRGEEPRAQIARDLSKALVQGEEAGR